MANSIQPVIMTADLNRLLAFYTELLGATQTSRVPGVVRSSMWASASVTLNWASWLTPRALPVPLAGSSSVSIEDVDSLLARVKALGGSVRGQPNNMPWGQRVAHIADPDGNTVNLTQPV